MASPGKKSFLLRMDPALWAELERLAAQELRSVNAQVEFLLREGLARRGRRMTEHDRVRAGEKASSRATPAPAPAQVRPATGGDG